MKAVGTWIAFGVAPFLRLAIFLPSCLPFVYFFHEHPPTFSPRSSTSAGPLPFSSTLRHSSGPTRRPRGTAAIPLVAPVGRARKRVFRTLGIDSRLRYSGGRRSITVTTFLSSAKSAGAGNYTLENYRGGWYLNFPRVKMLSIW